MTDPSPEAEPSRKLIPGARPAEGTPPSGDEGAKLEAVQFASGKSQRELEEAAKRADHDRAQRFLERFETLSIWAMQALFAIFAVLGTVWTLHLVLPERSPILPGGWLLCRWLTADQVTVIQNILTGGLVAGIVTDHFKKRVGR
jgi:hypothetical protein